ncbi:hypothetical protein FJQ98_02315 [Lysinibacillus agricola]|uniref:NERD domain-containing protein n=1 Tax=Lysinibacillus agricola TaxID=2590012 RepID=A0ABX7AT62_9BACI|nr:hypothetical protein [Lysinibacillus agricola]QQP12940.1 hypothetical protein FJQ98_02315 [Lysinibacillus agricola]
MFMGNSKKKEIINDIKNFVNTYQIYIDNDAPNYSNLQYMGEQFKKDNMRNEEICDYCKRNIAILSKSIKWQSFFNFVQIIFINQQVNKIEFINQFEIDYTYAMVMKYSCSDDLFEYDEYNEILHLFISLIRILYYFEVNSLNKDFQSLKISNYYRTRRFINNSTRFEIDKELIGKFKKIDSSVCFKKVSDWLEHIPTIVMERRNDFIKGEISLEEIFSFQLGDPQFIGELTLSEIELILKTFCVDFSEIKKYSDDDLYLVNRISNKFLVRNDNHITIINIGQLADNYISDFYELFNQMDNQRYKEDVFNIRDKFLDEQVAKLLSSHFGKKRVFRNSNWSMNGNTGENDCLVIIDSVALIFEAKSFKEN